MIERDAVFSGDHWSPLFIGESMNRVKPRPLVAGLGGVRGDDGRIGVGWFVRLRRMIHPSRRPMVAALQPDWRDERVRFRGTTGANVVLLNVPHRVVPPRYFKNVRTPLPFTPHRTFVARTSMNGLGGLIRYPFGGVVNVAATVRNQRVQMRGFNGDRSDRQAAARSRNAFAYCACDNADHLIGQSHWRMGHALLRHAQTNWIAFVQPVGLDESKLLIPCLRSRAAIIAGKPEAVPGFHPVIP